MNLYPENYDVTIGVAFKDLNGLPVTPTAVNAVLYDGEDELVHDFGDQVFAPGDTSLNVTVPAAYNVLADGIFSDARILRITLVTAAGEIRRSSSYIIQGESRLALMQNTFMSLEAAEILARDIPNLDGWKAATDEQRYAGLINSYHKLIRIPMRYKILPTTDQDDEPTEVIVRWGDITEDEFRDMPVEFRRAVRSAQLLQADDILENNPITKRHQDGIISETVGESSIMLRGGRLTLDISSRALSSLSGFLYYNFGITRV
ncbi:hypothetical protein [Mesorhizobium sp.]|uniref:hypothetical protein n=1 Tax=Mesorhizobium sp. TaxID=1871066 RepID=UPI000FE3893A|nr:hypothetical protein [Mesorhizobium sp.]RWI35421.1 MAG: hypothetical protein EOR14_28370 [Mesorhizobium sp.]RWJ03519.1 MAG: hypothetical protein EOR24_32595 [Mesorhizobium sp.]RWJ66410.1 MAG: hypothetical protein EOR34_28765 [Mesorhizobium sp.]